MKLKYVLTEVDQRLNGKSLPLMSVSKIQGVVPRSDLMGDSGRAESIDHYKRCLPGDLVVNRMAAYQGAVGIAPSEGAVSPDYSVIRGPHELVHFLFYFLKSDLGLGLVTSLLKGIGSTDSGAVRTPRLNWRDMAEISMEFAPDRELVEAVNYLDQETSQIDLLISKKEQLIEKLLERRQALITQVVTKGLDPNVPMKDSGVEWIGDIPRHWSASQLGRVLQSSVVDGPHETPVFLEEGHPFLSVDSIVDGELEDRQTRLISEADFNSFRRKARPERDDILMGKAASIGKIARVKTDWEFAIWSPLALLKISKSEGNPGFIEFSLKSSFLQAQIEVLSSSNTQKNLSMGKIPSLKIALPPLAEQAAIAEYLATETEQIGALISQIRKALSLLKERRQALITQVVTGKLDVRGFAGGNS